MSTPFLQYGWPCVYEVYHSNLGRGKNPHRRSPCTGPSAFVQIGAVAHISKSRQYRIIKPCQDGKRKYLSFMDMSRELQIEKPESARVYKWPVLKKKSKLVLWESQKKVFLADLAG